MGCLASLLLLSACSSEENMADTGNKIDVAKGIRFQFTEEAFVPGEVAAAKQGTRALAEPQEIDLGNGIIAEATLEPDTAGCTQTRAGNPVPDGTYKIYAIDAGGTRHDGLTGTMTGGVFTPSGHWELESGTYTFVCINSAVTDNGNELYVKFYPFMGIPLVGVTEHVQVTNPSDVFVSFIMRHQQARVRMQFVSYTEPMEGFVFTNMVTDASVGAGDWYLNLKGEKLRNGSLPAGNFFTLPIHLNRSYQASDMVVNYEHTTDYLLCSPDITQPTRGKISASLYGRTITPSFSANFGTLQKNHSYIWKLKLKNKDPWYLYNDGTIGSLGKRGSRTPIAVVVKEKTSTSDKGLACALNAGLGIIPWGYHGTNYFIAGGDGSFDNMKGYEYTYTTNYYNPAAFTEYGLPMATTPPAEQQILLPTYYYAAHYNPGVPVTGANIGKWFLPSAGQVKLLLKRYADLKEADMPTDFYDFWSPPTPIPGVPINITKLKKVFTDGGATWVGDQWALSGTDANNHSISVAMWLDKAGWNYESGNLPYMHQQSVYSFVYF